MPTREEWERFDRADARRRRRMLQQATEELRVTLSNRDGAQRILDISDEAWEEAQRLDAEGSTDAA